MCVLSFDSVRPSLRREFIYGLYTKITTFPLLILVDEAQHKNDPNIWGCFQYSSKIYQIIIFGSLLPNCCIPSFHANLLLYFLRRDSFFTKYLTLWHHHSTRFTSLPNMFVIFVIQSQYFITYNYYVTYFRMHRWLSLSTNCIEKISNLNALSKFCSSSCTICIAWCYFRKSEDSILR